MTPKEKAKELIEKYELVETPNGDGWGGMTELSTDAAKQCAIIAVGEIIEVLDKEGYDEGDAKTQFWNEVLEELKK